MAHVMDLNTNMAFKKLGNCHLLDTNLGSFEVGQMLSNFLNDLNGTYLLKHPKGIEASIH